MADYLDFDLHIGAGQGQEYPVRVLRSPAGEMQSILVFPFDPHTLERYQDKLRIALLSASGQQRQFLTPEERSMQEFGTALFKALFGNELRSCYDISWERAAQQSKGLRLRLHIEAPELAALPWELLYDPRQAEYICLSQHTPLLRYLDLPQAVQPFKVPPPLRILGILASPQGLPELDLQGEKMRLERALADLQRRGLVQLEWIEQGTWRSVQRALRRGPWHIVHFIGHGRYDAQRDEGQLALVGSNGGVQPLGARQLALLLADHAPLRLVVLNACDGGRSGGYDIFSSTASILVRRGLPAVLAMQYAISDRAAIELSRVFYESLADGLPVDAAVAEARKAIRLARPDSLEWSTPVLFSRAADGVLFDLPSPPPELEERISAAPLLSEAQPPAGKSPARGGRSLPNLRSNAARWLAAAALCLCLVSALGGWALGRWGDALGAGYTPTSPAALALPALPTATHLSIAAAAGSPPAYSPTPSLAPTSTHTAQPTPTLTPRPSATPLKTATHKVEASPTVTGTVTAALAATAEMITATAIPSDTATASATAEASATATPTPTSTPTASPSPTATPLPTQITDDFGLSLALIPAGEFMMGCDPFNLDDTCGRDEQPQHAVFLDVFYMDIYEVTNARYAECVADGICLFPVSNDSNTRKNYYKDPRFADYPVLYVNWSMARAYCTWRGATLPSEAQWEKAARGGLAGSLYPWGSSDPNCKLTNFWNQGQICPGDTRPAGSHPPNAYGLYDMAGNVWEWIMDRYSSTYYAASPYENPPGPTFGQMRLLRGGAWNVNTAFLQTTYRSSRAPTYASGDVGFRCVVDGR